MSEADLFRQYAKEAMSESSEVTSDDEKRSLIDLACIWVQAALMSERVFGSSFTSSPRDTSWSRIADLLDRPPIAAEFLISVISALIGAEVREIMSCEKSGDKKVERGYWVVVGLRLPRRLCSRSSETPSVTKNLGCGPSIRRRRRTATPKRR
jgi:hypothetical protein